MRNQINLENWRSIIGTTVLAAGLTLFAGAGATQANEECQERIVRADHHLHEAIEHHGYESRQAEHARMELHNAREYCWAHSHRWWDVEGNRCSRSSAPKTKSAPSARSAFSSLG